MGAILSWLFGSHETKHSGSSSSSSASRVKAFHSSDEWQHHFNDIKDTSHLVVIDFSASWCGPCKFIEPTVHGLADRCTDVEFIKIDVDELSDVAQEFSVEAMPTFVFIKNGKEVDRIVGANKDELEKKVKKLRVRT